MRRPLTGAELYCSTHEKELMKLTLTFFLAALGVATSCVTSNADILTDAGAGTGVDIFVDSGTAVTVSMWYEPGMAGPVEFSGVGLDLNWTPTGGATVALSGPNPGFLRGGAATGILGIVDMVTGNAVGPGTPLANPGLAPGAGVFSIGGGGHFDVAGGAAGISYDVPTGTQPLNLVSADFTISGAPGDSVTFMPSGILIRDDIYPMQGAGGSFQSGGSTYTIPFLPGVTANVGAGIDPVIEGVTVTIVPEPTTAWLMFGSLVALALGRRHT